MKKACFAIAMLFLIVFSTLSVLANPVVAETSEPTSTFNIPTVEFVDFNNGTTQKTIDYHNGTIDEITETILTENGTLQLKGGVDQSLSLTLPTSQEESTDYLTATEDLVTTFETRMGFTHEVLHEHIDEWEEGVFIVKWKVNYGLHIDIGCGLRLPLRIVLEYPERMKVDQDYTFYARVIPFDLLGEDFKEYFWTFEAYAFLKIWIAGQKVIDEHYGPDVGGALSFTPPLGPKEAFRLEEMKVEIPIWTLHLFDKTIEVELGWPFDTTLRWTLDIDLLTIKLMIYPSLASEKVTAGISVSGDAHLYEPTCIEWDEPNQRRAFNVRTGDYDCTTDQAHIQLYDLGYYFTEFELLPALKFDFDGWIDWVTGDPEIEIYIPELSVPISNLYVGVHEGYPRAVGVSCFVEKRDVALGIYPGFQCVVPGGVGTYFPFVINTGNVRDTYALSLQGIPETWYSLSETSISLDPNGWCSVSLTVSPPREAILLKDYPFTIVARSLSDPHVFSDIDGILRIDYRPKLPLQPQGGLAVAVTPKLTATSAGTEIPLSVTVVNNENFDDAIWLDITLNGIPTRYQADLSWFSCWTSAKVFVPAGSSITLQLTVTIPPESSSGYKIFKAEATSTAWMKGFAKDSGIIKIT